MWRLLILSIFIFLLMACSSDERSDNDLEGAPPPSDTTNTAVVLPTDDSINEPTNTPQETTEKPAIELLAGRPNTCVVEQSYETLMDFNVQYYNTTTANSVEIILKDADGNELVRSVSPAENRNDSGEWGFYPEAYELDDQSLLNVEMIVYETEGGEISSRSRLTYNCTTGETDDQFFERQP